MSDLTALAEAKAELQQALEAAQGSIPELEGIKITRGAPTGIAEVVSIYTAKSNFDPATLRNTPVPSLDEKMSVRILVEALPKSGKSVAAAEDRMWEIVNAVGTALRTAGVLGARGLFSWPAEVDQTYFVSDERQGCRALITLAGTSRI